MDSYSEVRRVRHEMSAAAGHDIRKLMAVINERRAEAAHRIIDPGTKAEQCDERGEIDSASSDAESTHVVR